MKFKSLLTLFLTFFIPVLFSTAQADTNIDTNIKAITNLLSQTTPSKNPKTITERMDSLAPQVKKISFPSNDKSLQNLTSYTSDAVKNADFKRAYQRLLTGLPHNVHHNNHWLDKLENATTTPTEYFSTPQGNLVSLSACKPHDCPTYIKLLYNPKTKKLWGLVHIDENKKSYLLGKPSDDQVALLFIAVGDEINLY